MNDNNQNTQTVFMELTTKKLEGQDKKIETLSDGFKQAADSQAMVKELLAMVQDLKKDSKAGQLPAAVLQELSIRLDRNISGLQQLAVHKIQHHHYVPKLTWIAAGLFIAFGLVCSGWYNTCTNLGQYTANDTKYRKLRLDTAQLALQRYLDHIDSLYEVNAGLRKEVIETERQYRVNYDRLQKANRLKEEAKALEKAAKEK